MPWPPTGTVVMLVSNPAIIGLISCGLAVLAARCADSAHDVLQSFDSWQQVDDGYRRMTRGPSQPLGADGGRSHTAGGAS